MLREYRLVAGLTQEELAELAHMSLRGVSDLERGVRTRPQRETVRLLADALGLDPDDRRRFERVARGTRAHAALAGEGVELPATRSRLIGRERECTLLFGLLRTGAHRIVTLLGTGGVGKTRLAMDVSNRIAADAGGRVAFVSLAPLQDPDLVPATVARAMSLEPSAAPALDLVVEHVGDGPFLLVLDNLEHLLLARTFVTAMVDRCPRLTVLVTSRVPLDVAGEHRFQVSPLDAAPAAELFLQRAYEQRPELVLREGSASDVDRICRQLDGLPLALELAAAWIRALSPAELAGRLDARLALLTAGPPGSPARHRTLRATLDWSHSLLEEREQVLFAELSSFRGGWTVDAAEAVCVGGPDEVLQGLLALVDANLVTRADAGEGETRFGMLETIREYASERLVERGQADELARRHARYFLDLVVRGQDGVGREAMAQRVGRLDQEINNVRVGLAWALMNDPELALRSGVALAPYWESRGLYAEGRSHLEGAVARAPDDSADRVRALPLLSEFRRLTGDVAGAVPLAREGVTLARERGDRGALAQALLTLVGQVMFGGEPDAARPLVDEGIALANEGVAPVVRAGLLQLSGVLAVREGNLESARERLERAWAIAEPTGQLVEALYWLAGLAILRGDGRDGRLRAEQSLEVSDRLGHRFMQAHGREMLARALILDGALGPAGELLEEAMTTHVRTGARLCPVHALEGFARLAIAGGQAEQGVRLLAAGSAFLESLHASLLPIETRISEQALERARSMLLPDAFERAWQEGRHLTIEAAVASVRHG